MHRYLILAQSTATANALDAWLELLGEPRLEGRDSRRIVWDQPTGLRDAVAAYETLVRRVEVAACDGDDHVPLNQVIALVDTIRPSALSVVSEGDSWGNLVAMLILTFPEIRWVFGVTSFSETGEQLERSCWDHDAADHSLTGLLNRAQRDPLFDPTALREWVRVMTVKGLDAAGDDLKLVARSRLAAAIDDEKPYAYLHGYTAYRFGCRVDVVTTWNLMKERFHTEGSTAVPHGYWLLLEDMSLNFADKEKGKHLLHLDAEYKYPSRNALGTINEKGRASHCNRLQSLDPHIESAEYRILVTTGQARSGDDALPANRNYLRQKALGIGRIVFKPASGMFDLWAKVGLLRKTIGNCRIGNAPGFFWPPATPEHVSKAAEGHGAPGKLMLVAEALCHRAEALLGKVKNVQQAVQGAVLATDALELTGGRTPTTAIEALSLKHQFEVLAECQFSGVEYHVSVKPRLDEIKLETEAICVWFHKHGRYNAALNAQMHILNALVRTLRAHGQFDEEQVCMHRIRRLHSTLWMRAEPWRLLFLPFIRYIEMLLKSFLGFVGVVFIWLAVLTFLFSWVGPESATGTLDRMHIGFENAVTSFFSVGPPMQHGPGLPNGLSPSFVLVSALCIFSGFLHLGVLVTHLYTVVSRR